MQVVVAGGHGQVALRLGRLLHDRGDEVTGIIRAAGQSDDLRAAGMRPVVLDLESASVDELAAVVDGADAVVFAAGAGPGSGPARKETVDRAAAVLLADAARLAGVRRYLLVSSAGVDEPPAEGTDEVWAAYLRAKKAAEDAITGTDLQWTVVRPGGLTDGPGTNSVLLEAPPVPHGSVTRDDTAAVLVALLDTPGTAGQVLELREGTADVLEAAAKAAR
jgi:uncharacterized protein YbjT (DUF2867 family)